MFLDNKFFVTKTGIKRICSPAKVWSMLIKWTDDHQQWVDLKLWKQSNQLQVANYATASGLAEEQGFAWWVPYTLKKRDVIFLAVKARRTTHQYVIEVPCSLKEALALNARNGDKYWSDAVAEEMGALLLFPLRSLNPMLVLLLV